MIFVESISNFVVVSFDFAFGFLVFVCACVFFVVMILHLLGS
jgi:hypothetical protein